MKKTYLLSFLLGISLFVLSAAVVSAAVPTATSTLDTLMTVIIASVVDLATTIFTTYWPYILIFAIIGGVVAVSFRFLRSSVGGHK